MSKFIASPRDFWTGIIYIALGAGALWLALGYRLGTMGKMGPGYFPQVLSVLLIAIGVVALVRSLTVRGEPITRIALKPLILIVGGIITFGLLIHGAGLVTALLAIILIGAAGSREFRFDVKAFAGMLLLVGLCALVFVKGLGLPLKLFGPWFEPVLTAMGVRS